MRRAPLRWGQFARVVFHGLGNTMLKIPIPFRTTPLPAGRLPFTSAARDRTRPANGLRLVFGAAVFLVVAAAALPAASARSAGAGQQEGLSSWQGQVLQVTRNSVRARLETGEMTIPIDQKQRNGIPLTVLVSGSDHVSVLQPEMFVEFDCMVDAAGLPNSPVLVVEARDQPSTTAGFQVLEAAAPAVEPAPPAATAAPPAGENPRRVHVAGIFKKIDEQRQTLDVWYPGRGKPGAPGGTFPIDLERTRVRFAFGDFQNARPNDLLSVRGFATEENAAITPVEIRIRRTGVFPEDESEQPVDPLADLGSQPAADADAGAGEMAADESAAAAENGAENAADQAAPAVPADWQQNAAVEVFDFPKNQPERTAEEKARRHYKIN